MDALLDNIAKRKVKFQPPTFLDLVFKEWAESVRCEHGVDVCKFEIKLDPDTQVFGEGQFNTLWSVVYKYFLEVLKDREQKAANGVSCGDINESEIFPLMKHFGVEYSQLEELMRRSGLEGLGEETCCEILRSFRLVVLFFLMTVFMMYEGNEEKTLAALLTNNDIHPEHGPVLGPQSPKQLYQEACDCLVILMEKHCDVPKELSLASSWPGLVMCLFGNLFVESGILSNEKTHYDHVTAESTLTSVLLEHLNIFRTQLDKKEFTWKEF